MLLDAQKSDTREPEPISLDMDFAEEGAEGPTPYEVLLHAAMQGDSTRFSRQDNIEETWRVMEPLLAKPPKVQRYKPGSWGPKAADALVAEYGGWYGPWIANDRNNHAQERGGPITVSSDRGLRLSLELPHRRPRRSRRGGRLALRATVRLAERLRQPA